RPRNEDAFIAVHALALFAVADGVSTRPHGEQASAVAIERVCAFLQRDRTWPMEADDALGLLVAAVKHANEHLHREAQEWPKCQGPATTFAALLLHGAHACIVHVGDSRVYRLREGELQPLTEDHTFANDCIRQGATPDEACKMRNAGVLTRGLGLNATVDVTGQAHPLQVGDVLLVCSDGLHHVVPDADIAYILTETPNAALAVARLIERANEAGGPDNISVVVVRVAKGGA